MIIPICRNDGVLFIFTVNEDCNVKVAEIEAFLDHQGSVSVHQIDASLFWKVFKHFLYISRACPGTCPQNGKLSKLQWRQ